MHAFSSRDGLQPGCPDQGAAYRHEDGSRNAFPRHITNDESKPVVIDHEKIKSGYQKMVIDHESDRSEYSEFFLEFGLRQKIEEAIAALPEKRQEIFRMAREEGLKYREIADKLNLSVKTVETQMTLSFRQLRDSLKQYRNMVMFFLFSGKGK